MQLQNVSKKDKVTRHTRQAARLQNLIWNVNVAKVGPEQSVKNNWDITVPGPMPLTGLAPKFNGISPSQYLHPPPSLVQNDPVPSA